MTDLLIGGGIALALIVTYELFARHPRLRCPCDHPHWLLRPRHERLVVMLVVGAAWLVALVIHIVHGNGVVAVLALLNLWIVGYRIWLHERGRRRRAARAVGRIVQDVHGRLRVAPA